MKTSINLIFVFILMLNISGCKTTSINNISPIYIPKNLSAKESKAAIVQAAIGNKSPDIKSNWESVVDSLLSAKVFGYRSPLRNNRSWYVEEVDDNSVLLGFSSQNYYMRVRLNVTENPIMPQIEESKNLRQSGGSIHKSAVQWIENFSVRARSMLGAFSAQKATMQNN